MKFKNYIETESGIKDTSTSPGTAGQLLSSTVAGTSWIDQNTISSGTSETIDIQVKNISSANGGINLSKGDPVYIYGSVGASARLYVDLADADSTATNNLGDSKMPCVALLDQDLSPNGEGTATVVGKLRNLITNPIDGNVPNENDTVYVKSGGGLTLTKPTGSTNLIQNVGQVGRVSTSADGNIVVAALLRSNDIPNLPEGRIWVGDSNTVVSDTVYLDETNERMGIGTTSPDSKLTVDGTTRLGGDVEVSELLSGDKVLTLTANNGSFNIGDIDGLGGQAFISGDSSSISISANQITTLHCGSNNRVGVGTTSPQEKMHVSGASNIRLEVEATDSTVAALKLTNTAGSYASFVNASGSLSTYDYNAASTRTTLLANGNFGIGTTNPSAKLDVVQATAANGAPALHLIGPNTNSSQTSSVLVIEQGDGKKITIDGNDIDVSSGDLFINDYSLEDVTFGGQIKVKGSGTPAGDSYFENGNVGIGITQPQTKLHLGAVSSSGTTTEELRIEAGTSGGFGGEAKLWLKNGQYGVSTIGLGPDGGTGNPTTYIKYENFGNKFYITTNSSTRMFIDGVGNVGIGTTTPQAKLHVSNGTLRTWSPSSGTSAIFESTVSNRNFVTLTAANEAELWFGNASTQTLGRIRYEMANNNMEFWTNATQKMVINSSGNVGMGTTSPNSKLHVSGTVSHSTPLANFDGSVGSGIYGAVSVKVDNINYGTAMKFYRSLSADNTAIAFQNGASTVGSISIGTSTTSYNTTSDYRLKENLTSITDGIDRLKQLKPRRFNFIGNIDVVDGFIAHEAKEVIPESVTGEKDEVLPNGDPVYQGIDQAKIVPLLTAALQEAISKIEQLETRIQILENK